MGRTGKLFAVEHWGVEPDIVCLAKGIATGLPLGAIIARAEVMDWPPGSHASTFGGNPVACAAGLATLDLLEEGLMENAAEVGEQLQDGLREIAATHNAGHRRARPGPDAGHRAEDGRPGGDSSCSRRSSAGCSCSRRARARCASARRWCSTAKRPRPAWRSSPRPSTRGTWRGLPQQVGDDTSCAADRSSSPSLSNALARWSSTA